MLETQHDKNSRNIKVTEAEHLLLKTIREMEDVDELVQISNKIPPGTIRNCLLNVAAEKFL